MGDIEPESDEVELRRALMAVKREHPDAIVRARRLVALGRHCPLADALTAFDDALRPTEWGYG